MPPADRPPNTLFKPNRFAASYCKNIAVVVWRARADSETQAVLDHIDRLLLEYAQFSVVHVVEEGVGLPTPEGRDAFMNTGRRGKDKLACVGVVLPSDGVIATTLRAFARTSRTVLRNNMNLVVEQTPRELSLALCEAHLARTQVRVTPTELSQFIETLRRLDQV